VFGDFKQDDEMIKAINDIDVFEDDTEQPNGLPASKDFEITVLFVDEFRGCVPSSGDLP